MEEKHGINKSENEKAGTGAGSAAYWNWLEEGRSGQGTGHD